jgi:hypothetical protein
MAWQNWEQVVPSDYLEGSTIRSAMERWGMPCPGTLPEAKQWYLQLQEQSYYTKALMVPFSMAARLEDTGGIPVTGILLAASTPQSAAIFKESMKMNKEQGLPILDPEWRHFDVYWHPGCAMMNIAALSSAQYDPQLLPEKLGQVLERRATDLGITDFQAKFCTTFRGNYNEGLRLCMQQIGISNWMEVSSVKLLIQHFHVY